MFLALQSAMRYQTFCALTDVKLRYLTKHHYGQPTSINGHKTNFPITLYVTTDIIL